MLPLPKFASCFSITSAALALASLVSLSPVSLSAGELVKFETPPIQPSPFRVKRAKAQGKTVEPTPGTPLSGVLSRPDGQSRHPAVILLPESVQARSSYDAWADFLTDNGFVTLVVDSLKSRNAKILRDDLPMDLQMDALGAHGFLSELAYVDPQRISLMGFGLSGNFVQRALDATLDRAPVDVSFFAGVVLYPNCDPGMPMEAPLLILAGVKDKIMSIAACQAMVDYNAAGAAPIKMRLYTEATHFFDNTAYARETSLRGEDWAEPMFYADNSYDKDAHAEAKRAVVEFLQAAE